MSLWRGALKLARPIPLVTWTASTVLLGVAAEGRYAPGWPLAIITVLVGGILLQGYITHGLNDMYDWHSGTDQTTPGTLSGGSHVLQEGLLQLRQLGSLVKVALGLYLVLLLWLSWWRDPWFLALGLIGVIGAVVYSLPPFRLCYRPLAGEWLGIFPPVVAGVVAAGIAANAAISPALWMTALIQGVICNASVMEHHLVDVNSDWMARPQKRTSPAYWQKQVGRAGAEVSVSYEVLALGLAVYAALSIGPRFWWSAAIAVASGVIAFFTREGNVRDETFRDWCLKALAVLHAVGYAALALLGVP